MSQTPPPQILDGKGLSERIKDEIAGPDATAVEVYPPQAEIVDDADMYHLWVLPAPLPFSLFPRTSNGV